VVNVSKKTCVIEGVSTIRTVKHRKRLKMAISLVKEPNTWDLGRNSWKWSAFWVTEKKSSRAKWWDRREKRKKEGRAFI